jgi:hypothetical protein
VVAMITKLVSNDNNSNSSKLPLYYTLEDTKYMTIITRQERKRKTCPRPLQSGQNLSRNI